MKNKFDCIFMVLFFILLTSSTLYAFTVPSNYIVQEYAQGALLFSSVDNNNYVQIVELHNGASLILFDSLPEDQVPCLNSDQCDPCSFDGPYFPRQQLAQIWTDLNSSYPNVFSVSNGSFFNTNQSPNTPLAFSLKVDGNIKACGYDGNYPDDMLLLELFQDGTADITVASTSRSRIKDPSSAPSIIGGLSPYSNYPDRYTNRQRTFVGVIDNITIVILNSKSATQEGAAQTLNSFGVLPDKIMMLDGGGSTQLLTKNSNIFINSTRTIPQSIGVLPSAISDLDIGIVSFDRSTDPIFENPDANISDPNFETTFEIENRGFGTLVIKRLYLEIYDASTGDKLWDMADPNTGEPKYVNNLILQPGHSYNFGGAISYFTSQGIFRVTVRAEIEERSLELASMNFQVQENLTEEYYTLSGMVTNFDNSPAIGSIYAYNTSDTSLNNSDSLTNGYYEMALFPGDYRVQATTRYINSVSGRYTSIQLPYQLISVYGDTPLNFTAPLTDFVRISGKIKDNYDNDIEGASISISGRDNNNFYCNTSDNSDSNGDFNLMVLRGTYTLQVRPPEGSLLKSDRYENLTINSDFPINLILTPSNDLLEGSLLFNDGSPATGNIYAQNTETGIYSYYYTTNGQILLPLDSGSYQVYADAYIYNGRTNDRIRTPYTTVFVEGSTPIDINIPPYNPYTVSGVVTDTQTIPQSNVRIYATSYDNIYSSSGYSDENGYFQLSLPSGTYRLTIDPPPTTYPNFNIEKMIVNGDSTRNIRLSLEYKLIEDALAELDPSLDVEMDVFEIINQADSLNYDIEVRGVKDLLQIVLNWGGSEMKISLYEPNGNLYGEFQSTNPPIVVEVPNPVEGTWKCVVTAIEVPYDNYPFGLAVGISPNQEPRADAGGPYFGTIGESLSVSAAESYDPDGDIVLYEWDWDNDGFFDESTQSPEATHTWAEAFSGEISLMVTDDEGLSNVSTASITISDPSDMDVDQDGYTINQGDCDDTDETIFPGATDIPYDNIDQDCNGSDLTDVDGDGFDAVETGGFDCDDEDSSINPDAEETCGDGVDNNCDGDADEGCLTFYRDADGDLFGDPNTTIVALSPPNGYVSDSTDCDDTDSTINPGAEEICNGIDDNCDGNEDEGCTTYYFDSDGDTYGDPASTVTSTYPPAGYVSNDTDCDDSNASINPGADEVCGDGIDNNCNGEEDEGCSVEVLGDLNGDGVLDTIDYYIFLGAFGKCDGQAGYKAECDYDGDECITFIDYQTWYGYYLNQ